MRCMRKISLFIGFMMATLTACQNNPIAQKKPHQPQQQVIVEAEKKSQQKPIIALVLGSGGARGYAHVGVLQTLEKQNIKPDFIVGTSAGSLVGVLYSGKQSAEQLIKMSDELKVSDIREFDFGLTSVFDGQKIADFVNNHIQQQKLEDLKTPVYVVATRLDNGERTVFNYGNAGEAVRASIAIPTMFAPVKIGEYEYVDGGLVSPVPVKIAKELGADMVIAVNILAQPHYTDTSHMWGLFNQNINIMQNQLADEEMKYADIVIEPDIKQKGHIFDVKTRESMIYAGELATQQQLNNIHQRMQQITQEKQEESEQEHEHHQ